MVMNIFLRQVPFLYWIVVYKTLGATLNTSLLLQELSVCSHGGGPWFLVHVLEFAAHLLWASYFFCACRVVQGMGTLI